MSKIKQQPRDDHKHHEGAERARIFGKTKKNLGKRKNWSQYCPYLVFYTIFMALALGWATANYPDPIAISLGWCTLWWDMSTAVWVLGAAMFGFLTLAIAGKESVS